jgi:hypothetical protein
MAAAALFTSRNTTLGYHRCCTAGGHVSIGYLAGAALKRQQPLPQARRRRNRSLTMRLGDNQTSTFIVGIAATRVAVMVDADGQNGVCSRSVA